jgi:hypothetical protein
MKSSLKAEITFDLVMDDDMPFVEGCYRLDNGAWHVFIFRKTRGGMEKVAVMKDLVWPSGVTGLNVIVRDETILNKQFVLQTLSKELGVTGWHEVQGPDSMNLR